MTKILDTNECNKKQFRNYVYNPGLKRNDETTMNSSRIGDTFLIHD